MCLSEATWRNYIPDIAELAKFLGQVSRHG